MLSFEGSHVLVHIVLSSTSARVQYRTVKYEQYCTVYNEPLVTVTSSGRRGGDQPRGARRRAGGGSRREAPGAECVRAATPPLHIAQPSGAGRARRSRQRAANQSGVLCWVVCLCLCHQSIDTDLTF